MQLAVDPRVDLAEELVDGPEVTQSGTYVATRPGDTKRVRDIAEITTLPAPPDDARFSEGEVSLRTLGQLVLEATNGRKR